MKTIYRSLTTGDAYDVARLHIQGIPTGFISSLGLPFVTAVYGAVADDPTSFGLVAHQDNAVIGFAAFSSNISRLYRAVVLKKGPRFAVMLAGKMFSLKTIKRLCEVLFYPSRTAKLNLPDAELLAIAVARQARGKGLGVRLLEKGLRQCAEANIPAVKVLVAADNRPANNLYRKCGFRLVAKIDSHGVPGNIYLARPKQRQNNVQNPETNS